MTRSSMTRAFSTAMALIVFVSACGGSEVLATVNGVEIPRTDLEALHPDGVPQDPDEAASSTFLLILHKLLTDAAESEFGVSVTTEERQAAFEARTSGPGDDPAARLAERNVTEARVTLDADLDVLRKRVQEALIKVPGVVDMEKAYRDFLAINASSCMTVLTFLDPATEETARQMAEAGETLEAVRAAVGDEVVGANLGCHSPVQHGGDLAAVALDGEIGIAYARTSDGIFYVAAVTERDAPPAAEHMDEILELAASRQGDALFDAWAVEILQTADVSVDRSIGTWTTSPDSGEVPVVVP